MSNSSETYPLELLFPTETVTLFFSLSDEVGVKDLVAAISCFDTAGRQITELESLPYSSHLARHYIYLRLEKDLHEEWVVATVSSSQLIKRLEVEVMPWNKAVEYTLEDALRAVWAGAAGNRDSGSYTQNFVTIGGKK